MSHKPKGILDLDPILTELGEFGRYQIITYVLILFPILFSALYKSQYIFSAMDLKYRCKVPQCESSPPQLEAGDWGDWALPAGRESCERFVAVGSGCSFADFHPNRTEACSSWIYESNNSLVAEFDLACQLWKRTMVGTTYSLGLFVALPLTSYISDRCGRRTAFLLTAVLPAVVGLVRSFVSSYVIYLLLQFFESVVGSGVYSTGYILALELVGLNRRVVAGNIMSYTFATGQVVLALIAYAIPYWKTLHWVLYTPSLFFIIYIFFIDESVRWLLTSGNKTEAAKIIFKAAKMNKKTLSPDSIKKLMADNTEPETSNQYQQLRKEQHLEQKKLSLLGTLRKSKVMTSRVLIGSFWWITVTFIYYGLSLNSLSLAGNRYVNYILISLVEIPGYFLSALTLDRFGRKPCIITAYFVCGTALIALPMLPPKAVTPSTLVGKTAISMVFSSLYIYTIELSPTVLRHSFVALFAMSGRIGTLIAMQTPLLSKVMNSLPYLMFSIMAVCSGLLMMLTPETLHLRLPDTVAQAEGLTTARRVKRPPVVMA